MASAEAITLAKALWDYHRLNHPLKKADCILVLGSHDLRVAEYAARLYHEGYAPLIIFSGGFGHLTKDVFTKPEAELFAQRANELGVPTEHIIIENKSSNTGENIAFTRSLLIEQKRSCGSFIVVQKPYMERRSYATFKKVWPEPDIMVTSPPISFEDYPDNFRSLDEVIAIVVGDTQRIKLYAEKGFQIPQEIPHDVWTAFERLVQLGYTDHLVK